MLFRSHRTTMRQGPHIGEHHPPRTTQPPTTFGGLSPSLLDTRYPPALHRLYPTRLGPTRRMGPMVRMDPTYLCISHRTSIQRQSTRVCITLMLLWMSQWVITHLDRRTTFLVVTRWTSTRIRTPRYHHQVRLTIRLRYRMGRHTQDHHLMVWTASRRGSSSMIGTSPLATTLRCSNHSMVLRCSNRSMVHRCTRSTTRSSFSSSRLYRRTYLRPCGVT